MNHATSKVHCKEGKLQEKTRFDGEVFRGNNGQYISGKKININSMDKRPSSERGRLYESLFDAFVRSENIIKAFLVVAFNISPDSFGFSKPFVSE